MLHRATYTGAQKSTPWEDSNGPIDPAFIPLTTRPRIRQPNTRRTKPACTHDGHTEPLPGPSTNSQPTQWCRHRSPDSAIAMATPPSFLSSVHSLSQELRPSEIIAMVWHYLLLPSQLHLRKHITGSSTVPMLLAHGARDKIQSTGSPEHCVHAPPGHAYGGDARWQGCLPARCVREQGVWV
ncbi:hypothetical protein AcV5_010186 [Taiwanofungus camphoratus]|nr:hypothetical protein AcV5_010186 [Antrodia cinnamomea]